ncbi:eCIS core domain-containing protein [Cellvibrio japonicus]|uniref:eCIS core domain-containing protein n=1 Tax=Cellvibrio japonicus (strain Ueda107) TaxID=498211 RepID=B3PHU7_CELJU|nr:DUF4157 domain-containing protein [Cellvibrio japonicus]ACE85162.1 hypothetical protein CJA_3690 [Cellvibrio japonicus Ueda107]QEI13885.1 DUF4157 domain-containing protein [Cellvibrio japonicus]QEI17459.1 DUF4157 domain-containing protein [Cellvibrio japonicus]QEI21035.1 DUF4157 domain-containing protein [Cellvibrio japonicus]
MSHVRVDNKTNSAEKTRQKKDNGTENLIQPYADDRVETQVQLKQQSLMKQATDNNLKNNTGLPNQLKAGIESLSGMSMDHVKVHYNSDKPAQLNAHAYAQGSDIHVAPGQEQHLPHEAWHVVQQAQGRVKPTLQMKTGVPVNDDVGLEHEADVMGGRALSYPAENPMQLAKNTTRDIKQNSIIQKKPIDINMKKVEAQDSSDKILLNKVYGFPTFKLNRDAKGKRGYIGTAIVWSGEPDAEKMANKYVTETQQWNEDERKARLAVNFLVNSRVEFEPNGDQKARYDSVMKAADTELTVLGKATSLINGVTWEYKYKGGGLPEKNTTEIGKILESGKINNDTVTWKDGNNTITDKEAKEEFKKKRAEKGVPYGALRSEASKGTTEIEAHLSGSNKTGEVYVHSIDADAPNFSSLIHDDNDGWLDILDAYDKVLDNGGDHDFLIGGYNLIAEPEEYKGLNAKSDFQHTVKANLIDIIIRQAAFQIEPTLIYPTEPNFLVKAKTYTEIEKSVGKKNAWGNRASEGRSLLDNYIKMRIDKNQDSDIAYNPLASVPTGVSAGGARLKIDSNKKYDENSLYGKPQHDTTSIKGSTISIPDQYVVQAQSWAGASRLAGAYFAAYNAKNKGKAPKYFTGDESNLTINYYKKNEIIKFFAPVETMVIALAKGEDPSTVELNIDGLAKYDTDNDVIKILPILGSIKKALIALHSNHDFNSIISDD